MCIRDRSYRCQNYDTVSWHTSGNNLRGIGICLIGNFQKTQVPDAQREELFKILTEIQEHIGPYELSWHSKHKNTSCPGKHLISILEEHCEGCDGPDEDVASISHVRV